MNLSSYDHSIDMDPMNPLTIYIFSLRKHFVDFRQTKLSPMSHDDCRWCKVFSMQ